VANPESTRVGSDPTLELDIICWLDEDEGAARLDDASRLDTWLLDKSALEEAGILDDEGILDTAGED
jgi:hypothetical protein